MEMTYRVGQRRGWTEYELWEPPRARHALHRTDTADLRRMGVLTFDTRWPERRLHAVDEATATGQAVIDSQDHMLKGCKGPQAMVVHSRSGLTAHSEKAEEAINSELSCVLCNASKGNSLEYTLSPCKVMGTHARCGSK